MKKYCAVNDNIKIFRQVGGQSTHSGLDPSKNINKCNSPSLFFENQFVDRLRLSEIIALAPSTISKLMVSEGLPYYKIGKACRFKVSEVVAFLEKRKRQ